MAELRRERFHIVVQPGPGAVFPALFDTHGKDIGIGLDGRPELRGALACRHPARMVMEPASQLDNFSGEVDGWHGGDIGGVAGARQSGVDCGENAR